MNAGLTPLWISLKTSLLATFITFFIGIGSAYLVANYKGKWRGLIDSLFTLPLVLPPTVLGFFYYFYLVKMDLWENYWNL